jgi:ornithine cyclodeaminase
VKIVTVFPDNGRRSLPSIYGQYLLLDGETGASLALLDGTMLTKRRTACAQGSPRATCRGSIQCGC